MTPKIKLSDNVYDSLSGSLSVCFFVQYFSLEFAHYKEIRAIRPKNS